MKIVVVQLSDVHLSSDKWPANPILGRTDLLLSAVRSLFIDVPTACIMLVNGDLAYAGLESEYEMALPFCTSLRDGLIGLYGQDRCFTVLLPGNHDCNFKLDTEARRQLIADAKLERFGDGSIADICTAVQADFFAFSQKIHSHAQVISGVERLFTEHRFTFGTEELVFRVLNSAWSSRINERSGSLLMPTDILKPHLSINGSAKLVATAIHHPYNWLEPTNARALRKLIEASSDLVFTGHEHESQTYSKTGSVGEHNEYIEAGPLQENGAPSHSEFNVIVIDTAPGAYVVHHFAWTGTMYEVVNDTLTRPFIRNNARLQGEFELGEEFQAELNNTDTAYQHPFKDPIMLEDIFVYPDLKEFSPITATSGQGSPTSQSRQNRKYGEAKAEIAEGATARRSIRGREIIDYVLGKRRVVLSSPDRAGKTALSRVLFKDLWRNGKMPLLLNGHALDSKTSNAFPKYLDRCFGHQYNTPRASRYWQLERDDRAIIIDDYHLLPNVRTIRDKVLAEISNRFGTVILIGGSSLRFQELISNDTETNLLADFTHCDLNGFGHKLRSQLIRRWFVLNRVGEVADDMVDSQVGKLEKVISIVMGRDLLPPFPENVLLLLQQLELRHPVDTSAASYGKLYQAYLTACLAKRRIDIETGFSYLSELAFTFFTRKVDHFDDPAAIAWHNEYIEEYKNPLDYAAQRDAFVAAGLLAYKNGLVQFRVKAAFYFFVAQYIAAHLETAEMQAIVTQLAGKLYRDDAANIILFLCHMKREPVVLKEVLASASRLFAGVPESDLFDDVKFTGTLVARLDSLVITDGDPEKRRQAMLEAQDADTPYTDPSDEMYAYRHEEETEDESEARRQIAQINGAYKTIQIIGQIARSFAGSLKGDQKRELAQACFGLGLRLLRFVFEAFKLGKDDFGLALQRRFQQHDSRLTEEKARVLANATVFMLVEMCTYGVVRHIAGSIGVERLAMTFKEIRESKRSIANRTIDAAIQLEHFANVPEDMVVELYDDVKDVLLMKRLIQHLAWDRLYYFHCPHDVSQRLCSGVEIKMLPAAMDRDQKRQ